MKAVRILLSAGILTAIAGTTFAADERIVTDEGVATFSFLKPASVRAEVGTTGYGGAISYNANPYVGVTLGYNGVISHGQMISRLMVQSMTLIWITTTFI